MSYVGKKPSFKQVRTNEIVVPKGTDITTAGVITALDVSNISFVKLTAATELQGIVAPESPAIDGKLVTIVNASSSDLVISDQSGGASVNNRIVTGTSRNMRITAGASFTVAYDVDSSRWRVTATSADVNIGRLDVGTGALALNSEDVSLTPENINSSLIEVTAGTAAKIRSVDTQNVGNLIVFTNKTGQIFQIKNEDTDVLVAEKRIRTGTGGPILIQNNASVMLGYLADRWHVVGGTGSGGGATEQVTQTGIGNLLTYPVGTPLYVDTTTGLWTKASAVSADAAEVAGLLGRSLNTNFAEVALAGEVSEVTADAFAEAVLPPKGSAVFLSTTAGKLTVSDVTTVGCISKPVGIVHNVTGTSSVDIIFYNQRGVVVGGVNARTQILLGGSPSAPVVTPIQNVSQYEAGEIAGWITINASTDYQFYFQAQFTKIPNTSNYSIAVPQTVGSTPPAGFSMDVVSGVVQVTLPALAGFVTAYVNFALNAPAVGATLPLSINSTSVYTTYKMVSGAYSIGSTDSLIAATGASTYAITLPTAVGALGVAYTIKSEMNAGVALTVNTTSGQLIDTVSSKTLATGEVLKVVSDGNKWIAIISQQDVTAALTASRAVQTDVDKKLVSAGFSLPAVAGSNLQFLSSNGDGTSSWRDVIKLTATTSGAVDASLSDSFIHNGSGSRTISVSNLTDGQTININVQGANGNVISWTTTGLTQKTGITYSNTMISVNSIFTLSRFGSNVFISSLHGFG